MKHVIVLLCVALALLSLSGSARAADHTVKIDYSFQSLNTSVEIAYYFQGLDVSTGTIYTDPMMFIILPEDEVKQILKPPADIMPNFDPVVDFFVVHDPVGNDILLVFLPKAQDDQERIVAVRVNDKTIKVDSTSGVAKVNIPVGQPIIFLTSSTGGDPGTVTPNPVATPVPEPSTMLLLGLGLLGVFGVFRRRKKTRCLAKSLFVSGMMLLLFAGNVRAQAADCQVRINESSVEYTSIQAAVDAANPGDTIKVAGTCTNNGVTTNMVNITKSLTLQGGYTAANWTTPDSVANPTIIDGDGIAFSVIGIVRASQVTVTGFWLTGAERIITVYPASQVLIERNWIHDAVISDLDPAGSDYTSGIDIESHPDFTTTDVIVRNNFIWNIIGSGSGGGGIDVSNHSAYPTNNIQIVHNTIYNVSQDGILMGKWHPVNNGVVQNNIIVRATDTGIQFYDISKGTADYNTVYDTGEYYDGIATPFSGGAHDLHVDPLFVNPAARDLHLQTQSPLLDQGTDAGVTTDIDGNSRPQGAGYDIGADEFSGDPTIFDYFMHKDPVHLGRFHDADKTGDNDSNKCHAAATSNILDWSKWDVPPTFDTEQHIFGNFQTNWEDRGSLVRYLARWWLDGIQPPEFGNDWATVTGEGGGYFPTGTEQSNFAGAYLSHWKQVALIDAIKEYLHSGYGTTITLYDSTDSLASGHVLSVWGYRYDADGNVLGLWVTDSDDVSSEPPQECLLPVEYTMGSGSEAKWRVSADSKQYTGWLLEGAEALKLRTATTPDAEIPKLAILRKKCVDNETGEEVACPENDDVTIWIGDQVCDEECKRIIVPAESGTALYLRVLMDPTNFKGLEVNGQLWIPGTPIIMTDDLYLRPVIGRCHSN
ncbi:parallel beta-helix repeat protein [Candidatus Vecturithrix granuli]|uniref:Parallel beta-helix repeat protein n=1 Tax=Vecturithrix granuli TaxID=1499967 RepID=A0A081BXY9_VECG1|nr:parallel beta-helix repeat protein [Candidatus Vecturithrix granuli]